MRSWKRRTRAQHKARYHTWMVSEAEHDHESKYVLSQIRKGFEGWTRDHRGRAAWEAWWSPIWRKKEARDQKADERHVKEGMRKFAEFPYYEDCSYHVCRPTEIIPNEPSVGRIDVNGISMFTGQGSGCSYEHCGIVHLTQEQGEERIAFAKQCGMLAYQFKYVYFTQNNTREKNIQAIRISLKMDDIWKFNENKGTERLTPEGRQWFQDTYDVNVLTLESMTQEEMDKAYEDFTRVS